MNEQQHPAGSNRPNGLWMVSGVIMGGVVGYFMAGSAGREIGGGLGAGAGLILGAIIRRVFT